MVLRRWVTQGIAFPNPGCPSCRLEVVPSCWFSRASRGSSRKQNAPPEQVEAGVTIRLALDQFQSVDLPFGLAVAPGRGEGGAIMVRATALRSSAWRSMPLASPKAKSPFDTPCGTQCWTCAFSPASPTTYPLLDAKFLAIGQTVLPECS